MKDLDDLHFFLSMEVEKDHAGFFCINQIGYLKEIFKCFYIEDCKAIRMPLDPKTKLKKNVNKDDEMVKVRYQRVLGSLMYAMLCTWPDLAYPISAVTQHMANLSLYIGLQSRAFFNICKALYNSSYATIPKFGQIL
jgi:ATP-binding cassette subfamily B (MDR/TAP) protein 1